MTATTTRVYRSGTVDVENFPLADVSEYLDQPDTVVWVDFLEPTPDDLVELASELGLHELAVEDALSAHQRPKVDVYETHMFMSMHASTLSVDTGTLAVTEIDAFMNDRWFITVRKNDSFDLQRLTERWASTPELAGHGPSYLLYGLLDVVVDGDLDVIDGFEEYYDAASEQILSERPLDPTKQRHWFDMRRSLIRFHRLAAPRRGTVGRLTQRDDTPIDQHLRPYLQDVYDHAAQVTAASDELRDLVDSIVQTDLSMHANRQNQAMKRVTSWAAIIAVPTLVTGFYGMNVPYPGSGHAWGVVMSTVLMVGLSLALYVQFRKRDWL